MKNPSVKKNYIYHLFNLLISIIAVLTVTPYTSRVFGAEGIGINSYTTAGVNYFTLFCMLGISEYGQREIAIVREDKKKASRIFWELQVIHFVTFVFCSALYFVLIQSSASYRIYYIAQYTILVSDFFDISWLFQGYERFDFIAIRNFFVKTIYLIAVFTLIHTEENLVLFILLNGISAIASNIALWFWLERLVQRVKLCELNCMRHMREIMIYFIPTIATSVYSILDKSVINWVTHEETQNGYYEQAYNVLLFCNVLVQSLAAVSSPRMSNVFANRTKEEFRERLNKSLEFMLMLSMPVAFGVCGIAKTFVPVFFGAGYEPVIPILYVFMPMVVVLGFSVYLDGMYLVPSGRKQHSAMAIILGACINLVLNFIFVTYWGAIGAAAATLLTETLIATIMIVMSKKIIDWQRIGNAMMKYFICSAVMFAVVRLAVLVPLNGFMSLILQIITGVGIYFLMLLSMRDPMLMEYLKLFKNNIKRKKTFG